MKRIIYTIVAAAAVLAGSVAAAAPALASSGPAPVRAFVLETNHPDTSNVCNTGAIGADCVWAHDNMLRQMVVTKASPGNWTVQITDRGTFTGVADPTTGATMSSFGPVTGSYTVGVVSANQPNPRNLPWIENGDVSTTSQMQALFGDPNAQVNGGPYSYSYQGGAYVQNTAGVSGDVRGH
jgi:hypothetical protein